MKSAYDRHRGATSHARCSRQTAKLHRTWRLANRDSGRNDAQVQRVCGRGGYRKLIPRLPRSLKSMSFCTPRTWPRHVTGVAYHVSVDPPCGHATGQLYRYIALCGTPRIGRATKVVADRIAPISSPRRKRLRLYSLTRHRSLPTLRVERITYIIGLLSQDQKYYDGVVAK